MPAHETSILRRLTLAALIATFLRVVTGNMVRVSGDNPHRPNWPLCFATVVLMDTSRALAEVIHRALAVPTTGLLTIAAVSYP